MWVFKLRIDTDEKPGFIFCHKIIKNIKFKQKKKPVEKVEV